MEQYLKWLERLDIVGVPLVVLLLAILVAGSWLLYCVIRWTHDTIKLAFKTFLRLLDIIERELRGQLNFPGAKTERLILVLNLAAFFGSSLFLLIGRLSETDHSTLLTGAAISFLVLFFVACIVSGSYASPFLD